MSRFEQSKLWQRSLAPTLNDDVYHKERELLRVEYEKFRDRAAVVAQEIAKDLPMFTVHDINHIDSLWNLSDLITNDGFYLTPTEAFVLGGAFLIHDLGMGLAAYPEGLDKLKKSTLWMDTVSFLLKKENNKKHTHSDIENPPKEIEQKALENVLRNLHAKHAQTLTFLKWTDSRNSDKTYFLIDNVELRESFGKIIGHIAHSHWWSVDELSKKFNTVLGAPSFFPQEWCVDPIKIATILRIADAANIDDSRSPGFLKTIRKISGYSELHWNFQQKLYQPRFEKERLVYTSKLPFKIEDADAGWLCYDTLKLLDNELREVDSLLSETGRQRLNVIGVASIEDPERLSKLITVDDWKPVDTKIKVGNVAELALRLGGSELYGDDRTVPLRELIQNACDAIKARRVLENESSSWGEVVIRKITNDTGEYLEIEDDGIGMSTKVLTGPFLDFGQSFWGSSLMHEELPGLESKYFESTGKYGIGFFSVFMIGEKVSVFSRRYEDARENTWCLEFFNGINGRPILRKALDTEYIKNGGTRIRIKLLPNVFDRMSICYQEIGKLWDFEDIIKKICLSSSVNILYQDNNNKKNELIHANDWIEMPILDLLKRIVGAKNFSKISDTHLKLMTKYSKHEKLIKEGDLILGRGFFARGIFEPDITLTGNMSIGGFYCEDIYQIQGVLLAKPTKAARDNSEPIASLTTIKAFVNDQIELIEKMSDISNSDKIFLLNYRGLLIVNQVLYQLLNMTINGTIILN